MAREIGARPSHPKSAKTVKNGVKKPPIAPVHAMTRSELSVIERLLDANLKLVQLIIDMNRPAQQHVPLPADVPWSTEPLHYSEEAEDALHAYRTGQIEKETLQDVLRATGFQNTSIDFHS